MNFGVTKSRAMQQASANTETEQGEVLRTYQDAQGNVSHADIRLPGQPKPLPRVPNSSGLRLAKGAPVTINWRQGSRYAPHITGGAGSAGGGFVAGAVGSGASSGNGTSTTTSTATDYSSTAFLLAFPDEDLPEGLTVLEGANVAFEDVEASGGDAASRTLHARVIVAAALPEPTGLLDGTLVDLVDGDGLSLGLYRLSAGAWIRRDVGAGGGGDGGATTAEVVDARSRYAISGPSGFVAYTYANLKNHLNAFWTALANRTASPNGVAAGEVLTADGAGGVVFAPPAGFGAAGGDASGTLGALMVTGLRGKSVTAAASDPANNQILVFDSGDDEWSLRLLDGFGTVTSVDASGGDTGLSFSGGPVTGDGTLTLTGTLAIAHGGTGGATAAAARANLGAAPLAWTIANFATTTGAGGGGTG